jgi:hypothetical protein
MPAAAQLAQNACVLDAAFEDLERPLESIGLSEQYFDHDASMTSAVATERKKGLRFGRPQKIGTCPRTVRA